MESPARLWPFMLPLTIGFGIIVGLSLGLTGGGGSILAVPLLVYGLSVPPGQAVGVSLAAVGATSFVGAVQRIWRQEVEIKTAVWFSASGIAGAPLGAFIGGYFPETLLLLSFSVLMFLVAVRMWLKASRSPAEAAAIRVVTQTNDQAVDGPACQRSPSGHLSFSSRCLFVLLISGLATGVLSGLFGVGGGFVIVPSLVLLTNLDIHRAVATSLLVIALVSAAGLVSHVLIGRPILMSTVIPFSLGGVIGLAIGSGVGRKLPPVALQKGFAVVILGVAGYVVARSIS